LFNKEVKSFWIFYSIDTFYLPEGILMNLNSENNNIETNLTPQPWGVKGWTFLFLMPPAIIAGYPLFLVACLVTGGLGFPNLSYRQKQWATRVGVALLFPYAWFFPGDMFGLRRTVAGVGSEVKTAHAYAAAQEPTTVEFLPVRKDATGENLTICDSRSCVTITGAAAAFKSIPAATGTVPVTIAGSSPRYANWYGDFLKGGDKTLQKATIQVSGKTVFSNSR
jgi:hypothetical protein